MRNRAYIYDRGALNIVGEVQDPLMVQWGRVRDDTSESHVQARSTACNGLVSKENVGRYELVVERDGKRQWEGPITYLNRQGAVTEIKAKDITWYLNRTALTRTWDNSKAAVFGVDRLRSIIEYECAWKEANGYRIVEGMLVREDPEGARTMKVTLPYEKYVFEELDDMAWRSGIDYVVIRRRLLLHDTHTNIGEIRPVTQADFDGDIAQTTYGVELATRSIVADDKGRAGIYEGVTGTGTHPYYGEVVLLNTEYGEDGAKDENSSDVTPISVLKSQAQRNYAGRSRPVTNVRTRENSRLLGPAAEELMPYLIPGVNARVLFDDPGIAPASEMMRLNSMDVREDDSGEQVTVSFSSMPGTSPTSDEDDEG